MNKKNIIIISIAIIIIAIIGGGWYYKYNYVDTVTSYIKIEYTPPTEKVLYDTYDDLRKMVSDRYSKPKVEFKAASYQSDSLAYEIESRECAQSKARLAEDMGKLKPEMKTGMSEAEKSSAYMIYEAELQAYTELINTQTIILSFTHIRKFDYKQMLTDIRNIGFDKDKLDSYMKKNKMSFKWIPID